MAKADRTTKASLRADGRVPLMVYMLPKVVHDLKKAALDSENSKDGEGGKHAYEIVEEAVLAWLASNKKRTKRS